MASHHPSIEEANDDKDSSDDSLRTTQKGLNKEGCFFDGLTEELLLWVLTFVPASDLLRNGCLVCTRFKRILQEETFWKSLESSEILLKKKLEMPLFTVSKHQLQRYALYQTAFAMNQKEILDILEEGSVLSTCEEARRQKSNGMLVCAASTTDRASEELENVLSSRIDQAAYNFLGYSHFIRKWWSSRPTPEPDTRNEVLVFTTSAPICVLTQVSLKPLLDPYIGHTIYSWKYTKIRAYFLLDEETNFKWGYPCTFLPDLTSESYNERARGRPARQIFNRPFAMRGTPPQPSASSIPAVFKEYVPVYDAEYPVTNPFSQETLVYDLPNVIANVVTFELVGKNTEQTQGSGYYACVEALDCRGIPLHACPPK
eukprot:scaffold4201_cov178-Amphora_coffeaeformis.AAC.6